MGFEEILGLVLLATSLIDGTETTLQPQVAEDFGLVRGYQRYCMLHDIIDI